MRVQLYLRIATAAAAVSSAGAFVLTRDSIDLVAAGLFALVTYSTGQERGGALLGALAAGAAALVIRLHQVHAGVGLPGPLLVPNLVFPALGVVLAGVMWRQMRGEAKPKGDDSCEH